VESSEPPVSQTTISKKIQRNLNTISMIVDRMEKLGLVKRVRSEEDRRETHVSLTPLGKEKLAKAIKVGSALKDRLSGALTDEDLEQSMRLMAKFRDQILKEMGREPMPLENGRTSRRRIIDVFKKNLSNSK
jgi:DNA-binding MarR family transcriptional regulator